MQVGVQVQDLYEGMLRLLCLSLLTPSCALGLCVL